MQQIFESIYSSLHASSGLALTAAFVWGVFSILLSPCNLVTIPLVVGYIESTRTEKSASAFTISLAFSSGIFVNCLVGMVLTSTGINDRYWQIYKHIVACVFFLIGLPPSQSHSPLVWTKETWKTEDFQELLFLELSWPGLGLVVLPM